MEYNNSEKVVKINGLKYELNPKEMTASVAEYQYQEDWLPFYPSGEVTIPSAITYMGKEYTVTEIELGAFEYSDKLLSVVIPDTVYGINACAFMESQNLTSVVIPNSVQYIDSVVFHGCKSLKSITIPASVNSIYNQVFNRCLSLERIKVDKGNPVYDSREDCNAIIETATNTLIRGCAATVIPATVTKIGRDAFCGCGGLSEITIPDTVTTIGFNAFCSCAELTSIYIPKSVISIDKDAFKDCPGLTSITVEDGNPVYDSRQNCNALIETATNTLIAGCQNTVIPDGVAIIGEAAFYNCGINSITIPDTVTMIGAKAFYECAELKNVNIPGSVKEIGENAFYHCDNLTEVIIPDSVRRIGEEAFSGCSRLQSLTIGNSSVGEDALSGHEGLTNLTIPFYVTSIGYWAFNGCSSLTHVYVKGTNPHVYRCEDNGCEIFTDVPSACTLHVPKGCADKYRSTAPWKQFKNIVEE